tara:strand:- start:1084 stop:1521 length:438 start_codon:yes stop_codon:yes gene_type:complete
MISESSIAYIAGLFDGEGSINFTRRPEKKKKHKGKGYRISNSMRISMEITMTDESVIRWVHDLLKVGTVNKKPRSGFRKNGTRYLMQWRWRCTFRDAYYVARLLWPYAQVKMQKIEKIIDHYAPDYMFEGKVVSLQQYKEAMSLE